MTSARDQRLKLARALAVIEQRYQTRHRITDGIDDEVVEPGQTALQGQVYENGYPRQ
jgi:hypothetical protein